MRGPIRFCAAVARGLLLALACVSASAQVCSPTGGNQISLVFINGVDNTSLDYAFSKLRLTEEYGMTYLDTSGRQHEVRYPTFYNPTHGKLIDLYETVFMIKQQYPEWDVDPVALYAAGLPASLYPDWVFPDLKKYNEYMAAALATAIASEVAQVNAAMRDKMLLQLAADASVVVVSHSQGNLFSQALYAAVHDALAERDRDALYKMLHVAPPAAIDQSRNTYITNTGDLVINAIRVAGSRAPEGNVTVPLLLDPAFSGGVDHLRHGFTDLYMVRGLTPYSGSSSHEGIRDALEHYMEAVSGANDDCVAVDSRSTWLEYHDLPPDFPSSLGPVMFDLAAHGIQPGDVLELSSQGSWLYSAYWGNPGTAVGAAGVFQAGGQYVAASVLQPSDPGSAAPAAPMVTACSNVIVSDNPADFLIPDTAWSRVRVPAAATHLLLGVPDCFHGDNEGVIQVAVRKVTAAQRSSN
ncbi:hypothetical protein GJ699_31685 [Duganella sp. FT80W]|uniref:Uncharacterized protein n=1 Tax=Duganella guangzhouensis TaxID=2666084 RepID=A0A6I2L9R8_9BURK|nr:hypothetical protein [Duganella guangzhouensis]MRW94540.1 hypothetical protein [Duganella guangzhouensis]